MLVTGSSGLVGSAVLRHLERSGAEVTEVLLATFSFAVLVGHPHRIEGRSAIVAAFQEIFGDFPARMSGPPYLTIDPRDVEVQVERESAVVTFHLGDSPPFSRRTLVFARRGERWSITHLHASDAPR